MRLFARFLIALCALLAGLKLYMYLQQPTCLVTIQSIPSDPVYGSFASSDGNLGLFPGADAEAALQDEGPPLWRPSVRIAYLVSVQADSMGGTRQLLDWLYHPDHTFIVHVHNKTSPEVAASFAALYAKSPNVHVLALVDAIASQYSMVELQLALLHKARAVGGFDVAINLCGQSVPIKSNWAIDQYLASHVAGSNGSSLVSYETNVHACHPDFPHKHVCSRAATGTANPCVDSECKRVLHSPGQRPWFKGWAYFALRPEAINYVLDSNDARQWLAFFQHNFLWADESYLQTILHYAPFNAKAQAMALVNPMYQDWKAACLSYRRHSATSEPCTLGINDLGVLRMIPELFARLIDWEDPLVGRPREMTADANSPSVPVT